MPLLTLLERGTAAAKEAADAFLRDRARRLWERATWAAPAAALELSLRTIRVEEERDASDSVAWAPAWQLAAAPASGFVSLNSLSAGGRAHPAKTLSCRSISCRQALWRPIRAQKRTAGHSASSPPARRTALFSPAAAAMRGRAGRPEPATPAGNERDRARADANRRARGERIGSASLAAARCDGAPRGWLGLAVLAKLAHSGSERP